MCDRSQSGNIFFTLFAAVAMLGAVAYGFNTVLRGPVKGMTDVTKRTVAENTVITSGRMAIVGATTLGGIPGGDCDSDGKIEPLPYFDAGTNPHPAGGGWLPRGSGPPAWTLVPDSIDPWKSEYGYCAWDSGSLIAQAGCGGATGRLAGSPNDNRPAIAIISAGKDRTFQTTCSAYNGASPNALLVTKAANSDDIVLVYTYAEANNLGNDLWKPSVSSPSTTSQSNKNIAVTGGGTFSDKIVLSTGGLVLPGDPGDDSITGACNAANDKQMRRNTSTIPPTLEICDFTGGLGWNAISGGAGSGGTTGSLIALWKLDASTGTVAVDSAGGHAGILQNAPLWAPTQGMIDGAIDFDAASNKSILIQRNAVFEPTAFTVSFWMKRNGTSDSSGKMFSKVYPGNKSSIGIGFNAGNFNQLVFTTEGSGGTDTLASSDGVTLDGAWVHVAVSYDHAGAAPQKKIYINGVLDTSKTLTDTMAYDTTSAGYVSLGSGGGALESYKGLLDDVRFYNYALTDTDISNLYDTTHAVLNAPKTVEIGKLFSWGTDINERLGNGSSYTNTDSVREVLNGDNFVQVDTGDQFACGVNIDGKIYCWGDDTNGHLGNGSTYGSVDSPAYPVASLGNVKKVSAGNKHACALLETGEIWCWGDTQSVTALGDGVTTTTSQIPVQVTGNKDYVDVSAGYNHTCAVRQNGEAWCWGGGTGGQLGNAANSNSAIPVKVSTVNNFLQIDANLYQPSTCGVTKSGSAYCWGTETANGNFANGATSGVQNTPSAVTTTVNDIAQISAGPNTTCVLRHNGQIWCAGNQTGGRVGNGLTAGNTNVLARVLGGGTYKKVSFGESSGCGLSTNNELWCWGQDNVGQLGNGPNVTSNQATPVKLPGENYIDVNGGSDFFLVLQSKKFNKTSNIDPRTGRIAVSGNNTADAACYIDLEGVAWCWGTNTNGQLGNGTTTPSVSPVRVVSSEKWKKIVISKDHACGIKKGGTLWCWGNDASGQLGNGGTTGDQTSPYQVGTELWNDIAVATDVSCGIKVDGTAWCWGNDTNGVLGNGATSSAQTSPAAISETGPWKKISVGMTTACAIKVDDTAWCWGDDSIGSVGNGSPAANVDVPVRIKEPGPWQDISAGFASCGIKTDGTAWCWGDTDTTGSGSTGGYQPEQIRTEGAWSNVSTSNDHICGIKMDGTAWCWGHGTNGKLGNAGTAGQPLPVAVVGGGSWIALEAGNNFTCGIKANESVWCWGSDSNGKLGNGTGTTTAQSSPYRIEFIKGPKWPIAESLTITSFGPPYNAAGINIGTGRAISEDGTAGTKGFMFDSSVSGRQNFLQSSTGSQLTLETNGGGTYSPQVGFKTTQNTIGKDNIPGLVARWKLDESAGTTAVDMISGNTGTINNTVTWAPAGGKLNGNAAFNGSVVQSYISAPDAASFKPKAFTLSFWMRSSGTLTAQTGIVGKDYPPNTGPTYTSFGVQASATNNKLALRFGYATNYRELLQTNTISASTWYFVTGSYDPSAGTNNFKLYLDGALNNSATYTDVISYNTGSFYIGAVRTSAAPWFSGDIDDVRVYDRQLTDAEVLRLYNSYSPGINLIRSVGLDYVSGSLEFSRNGSGATSSVLNLFPDMEVSNSGDVGFGTKGHVRAKADVEGAVKIGNDGGACNSSRAGTIDYNSGSWQYCNGTSWKSFGTIVVPWSTEPDALGMGGENTCAIKVNGTLWCWGMAGDGAIGDNQTAADRLTPVQVHSDVSSTGWSDWKTVDMGLGTTTGVRTNGTAWSWGLPHADSGGYGPWPYPNLNRPGQIQTDTGPGGWSDWLLTNREFSNKSCGLRANGTAWCWGSSANGRLGNGTTTPDLGRPGQVKDSAGTGYWSDWKQISVGNTCNCGLRSNGTAWCWGDSDGGCMGNNTTTSAANSLPVQVYDSAGTGYWTDWVKISAGKSSSTCGLRSNGTAWCWGGDGWTGMLGDGGTSPDGSVPRQVQTDTGPGAWSDWIEISAGESHACGLRVNGTAWCWGANGSGTLGSANTTWYDRPHQVVTDTGSGAWSDWVSIKAGNSHTCGVRTNGNLYCWGSPSSGKLGDGQTAVDRLYPVRIQ